MNFRRTFQARGTLLLCAAAAMFEGFDNQSMGVAAPAVFREFAIPPSQGGLIFSAANVGLLFGAALGGRAADRLGRKQTLVLSLLLFGLCSLLTSVAHSARWLIAARLATGLGLGAAMPNFIAMAAEAVDPRRRVSAVTLVMAALPLGGATAALMALGERLSWGWRPIFVVGGVAPILVALLIARVFATGEQQSSPSTPVTPVGTVLWGMDRAVTTSLLWAGFFFTQLVLFLMLNWLPSLIVGLGFSHTEGSIAAIGFNLAGSLGAASLGRLHGGAQRGRWVLITYGAITVALASLAAVAYFGGAFPIAVLASALAGMFIIGAQLILYALAPLYYQSATRGTGIGAAVAIGRLGSVVGPLFAASLLASGGRSATVLTGIVPFVLVAGMAAYALTWRAQSSD